MYSASLLGCQENISNFISPELIFNFPKVLLPKPFPSQVIVTSSFQFTQASNLGLTLILFLPFTSHIQFLGNVTTFQMCHFLEHLLLNLGKSYQCLSCRHQKSPPEILSNSTLLPYAQYHNRVIILKQETDHVTLVLKSYHWL